MKANEIGLPTFEAEVSCGAYCQGGSVKMNPTTYPEFEEAEFVWVRGEDAARLAARLAEAEGRLVATDALIDALRFSSREAESEAIELSKRLARVEDAFTRWFGECGCGGETCPTCNVERAMQSETVSAGEGE